MRYFLVPLLLFFSAFAFGQSISELEAQLKQATGSKEKMSLNYELGEAWLKQDAKKSIAFAKTAHGLAVDLKDNGSSAEAAFLVARAYDRTRDDRNEDVWLQSAVKFAIAANDADLIMKTVDKRSRLAISKGNERKALQITQEAFDYFSSKGDKSISEMLRDHEIQRGKLLREKKALEDEKNKLEKDVKGLSSERDNLKEDKTMLAERQRVLQKEKEIVEEEISQKEAEIQTVSAEKARALYMKEVIQRSNDKLKTRQVLDSLAVEQANLGAKNAKLESERGRYLIYILGVASLFMVLLAGMLYLRFLAKKKSSNLLSKQNKIIEQEQKRSDELLYNIMPVGVAKELKEKGAVTAQQFPEATVLFTDFVNFTNVAERLTPAQLVEELNTYFRAFDHIIDQYPDIEKIKTIGDAYFCASGLVDHKTIPKSVVKAALEMQEFLHDTKEQKMRRGLPFFEARIGIHTGPVVAGVVGFKKYAYDIWGDTVNIASRMEQNCEPGKVNISETTFGLVKYFFECRSRGKVAVKNKGMMEMYYAVKTL